MDHSTSRHTIAGAVPRVVIGARVFLGAGIVAWSIGVVLSAADVWRWVNNAPSDRVEPVFWLLVWRATLLVLAVFAYRGMRRRWPSARWLTIALAMLAFYRTMPSLTQSWRAIHGDYRAPSGAIAYASAEEGTIATVFGLLGLAGLVVLVQQLAAGQKARAYFDGERPGNRDAA